MGEARAKQLADRIQVLVAQLLERRVKDPRLGFVTVTDAKLTGDLSEASVFYTVYGGEQERASTAAALESARGLIRSEVGKALGLRRAPSLAFYLDAIPETAGQIEELLAKARAADAEVAKAASGAKPAGDADPYKRREDDDSDDE
ncbi:ribosome-binding factor A [Kribbella orskensis]|jgi:ribosome-binding factor A|uniref:Ribosome-binding factor A n=1 Tax=Kribbella orskensis TaxID=2512216 RepID=A0ABY2BRQ7_9ACTN|nr:MULTISPECIES: 30S ribosome-binding factor RbfA [Kribbella]TCN43084.1 ribosome-binding factor A [Kribbella sp. VKM Ac-2500]TCO29560.1 ribosome-binding factor A [Kribbella orskensis]